MIDSHTHLDRLREPVEEALAAAAADGVTWMLSVGTDVASSRRVVELAHEHESVGAAVGVHPNSAADVDIDVWQDIVDLASDPAVVAIGETGYDQFRPTHPTPEQQDVFFRLHCELARERNLPLIIHTRSADDLTLDGLAQHADGVTVIMHCFSMADRLDEVLERGYYVSFAGNVTYGSAGDLRDAAARVPDNRVLAETDAPYLTPVPHRGTPNTPARVVHTYDVLADVRGTSTSELGRQVSANAAELFRRA